MAPNLQECKHEVLQLEPSPFAELAGYIQPSLQKRTAATTSSTKLSKVAVNPKESISTFPAPLVLPFDDLNYDPDAECQDFKSWLQFRTRNKVTRRRQTIYVARVPEITKSVNFMRGWTVPNLDPSDPGYQERKAQSPNCDGFIDYVSAFYHGMTVNELPVKLKWTSWDEGGRSNRKTAVPQYVALQHGNDSTRIRTRIPPDNVFPAQLNLNDILDGAIRTLPSDAHSLLLLIDHDMWEEDDDFCCGRAYGGSRVCVVQTARYNPALDSKEGIDRSHMWPLSHCKKFVDELCRAEDLVPQRPTQLQLKSSRSGPMRKAVDAAVRKLSELETDRYSTALWFSRLARTVSHELAHCFSFAHCVYYACNSQGTAGMKEDVRQPPYLCLVCEAKISHAVAIELLKGSEQERAAWVKERCLRLREFCGKLEESGNGTAMWSGLDAWLQERMLDL